MAGGEPCPQSLDALSLALAAGQRKFLGLRLRDLDEVDLDGFAVCEPRAAKVAKP
ncbi:MAG: hypothetical protein ACKOPT_01655 [Cyanobium sp.]